ncbi:MAG: hypothetical protein NVSMB63_20290 [Sediminibacterium sp.]
MERLNLMNTDLLRENKIDQRLITNERPVTTNNSSQDKDIKTLIGGLKNDGIITSENYTVEIRNNRLFVDGREQTNEINDKYIKYFGGKGDLIIKEYKVK